MTTIVQMKEWSHTSGQALPKTITLDQPCAAGNKLVLLAAGGALVSGTGFTKRTTYGTGAQDVSISDMVTVGGETSASITLNGQENVSGVLVEASGLGAYIGSSNNGTGTTPAASGNFAIAAAALSVGGQQAVGFAIHSEAADPASRPYSLVNRWRQLGPIGRIIARGANQPGSNSNFIWSVGVADLSPTSSFPKSLSAGQYQITSQFVNPGTTAFTAQAFYANSGSAVNPAPANSIAGENSLPGTHSNNWFVSSATNATIAGYTDKCSYSPGETVNFKVDSTGNPFRVEIYRLGHYGWESLGSRHVLGNNDGYITGTIVAQSAPTVDPVLGSTSCGWTTNATWTVPSDAVTGLYYVLFRRTDVTTNVASCHFVVKGSAAGKMAVVIPDFTYQAYNAWGSTADAGGFGSNAVTGRSLYRAGSDGAVANFGHRSYACSFDRPYHTQSGNPNTYMFDADYGFIHFAEAQGYNLTYFSDVDLENDPTVLDGASAVVMLGHTEYWSTNVYDAYKRAINAGTNTFVYASNIALWRVRFAAGDTAKRIMICYKDSGTRDQSAGFTGNGYDPLEWTGTWRDVLAANGRTNSDVRRENALTGLLFMINGVVTDKLHVPFASKGKPIWRNSANIQALTSGQTFITVQNAMGYEVDLVGYPSQPANLVELNPRSMSFAGQGANAAGSVYTSNVGPVNVGFIMYRHTSGALVFNTGNWRGWWGVDRWFSGDYDQNRVIDLDWQNALLAVLYDLGVIPSTLKSLRPGIDADPVDPATGAPSGTRDDIAEAYGLEVASGGLGNFFFLFE